MDDFTKAVRYESVNCVCGVYIAGTNGCVRSSWWTSDTTPMTVRQGPVDSPPILTCEPIGLSFPQMALAVACEITMTG